MNHAKQTSETESSGLGLDVCVYAHHKPTTSNWKKINQFTRKKKLHCFLCNMISLYYDFDLFFFHLCAPLYCLQ